MIKNRVFFLVSFIGSFILQASERNLLYRMPSPTASYLINREPIKRKTSVAQDGFLLLENLEKALCFGVSKEQEVCLTPVERFMEKEFALLEEDREEFLDKLYNVITIMPGQNSVPLQKDIRLILIEQRIISEELKQQELLKTESQVSKLAQSIGPKVQPNRLGNTGRSTSLKDIGDRFKNLRKISDAPPPLPSIKTLVNDKKKEIEDDKNKKNELIRDGVLLQWVKDYQEHTKKIRERLDMLLKNSLGMTLIEIQNKLNKASIEKCLNEQTENQLEEEGFSLEKKDSNNNSKN